MRPNPMRVSRHAAQRTRILRTYRHTQQGRLWVRPAPASWAAPVACVAMLSATMVDLVLSVLHPPLPWFVLGVSLHLGTLTYFVGRYVVPDFLADEQARD